MEVVPYAAEHAAACLAIFDANMPEAFHPGERAGFEGFLKSPSHPYFAMLHEGNLIAAGGFRLLEDASHARLHWGMVLPRFQRQGLGRYLLLYRLREIARLDGVEIVEVGTTPHAAPFFEKQGFHPVSFEKDGWGVGMDRVELRKKLKVCP